MEANQSALESKIAALEAASQPSEDVFMPETETAPAPAETVAPAAVKIRNIEIPRMKARAIMGRGGERINKIGEESGAIIEVDRNVNKKGNEVITIVGTDQQIEQVEFLHSP